MTELLVEQAVYQWHLKHGTGKQMGYPEQSELNRQRQLNPAYEPKYAEHDLLRAAEILPTRKDWTVQVWTYRDRPVRDLSVLRFMPWLESLNVMADIPNLDVLDVLPNLVSLSFSSPVCRDYRPITRCKKLRTLSLTFGVHWPEVDGLETLSELESLTLSGNLLVFPRGIVFPKVKRGGLACSPLFSRNVRDLPQFPACEFLSLGGVERLDGIEAFPLLRNLTLSGPLEDFSPLASLDHLTCLSYSGAYPLDVAPLAKIRKLHYLSLQTQHQFGVDKAPLRDLSPLMASETLRQVTINGCPPLEIEVSAMNAALPPCEDLFLAPEPRPLAPLRLIVAEHNKHPRHDYPQRLPDDPDLIDAGMREQEGQWVQRYVARTVRETIGHSDWGTMMANGEYQTFFATIESYEVVERLPEIIHAMRGAIARLKGKYLGGFMISLSIPPPKPTPAQDQLMKQFREEQDQAEYENRQRDHQELLDKLYLYQLKKQQGEKIDPAEFEPSAPLPDPLAPWEKDEEGEDDEDGDEFIATKKRPDPPPDFWDDGHPLADNYRLMGVLSLNEMWISPRFRGLAVHLMGREPDMEIPDETPKE